MCLPLTYFCRRFLFQRVEVAKPSNIGCDPPIVELVGCLVYFVILRHRSDDAFFKPGREGFNRLASCCRLSIDVEDVRGTSQAVAFGECGNCAIVQQLDPFDGSMDAVAVADSKAGEAFVFFIPWGYLLPCLLLESFQSLVKISNGLRILLLLLMADPVLLPDGLNEGLGEVAESDWVVDVKALNDVSCRRRGDRIGVGDVEAGNGHEDRCRGAGGAIGGHGDISVRGSEWKGVR